MRPSNTKNKWCTWISILVLISFKFKGSRYHAYNAINITRAPYQGKYHTTCDILFTSLYDSCFDKILILITRFQERPRERMRCCLEGRIQSSRPAFHCDRFLKQIFSSPNLIFLSGIWWIFEFISTSVGHKDYGGTCTIQIILDLPNLLAVSLPYLNCEQRNISCWSQGVLIFVATVSKKTVVAGLKDTMTTSLSTLGRSKAEVSETSSSLNTKDTSLASTSM